MIVLPPRTSAPVGPAAPGGGVGSVRDLVARLRGTHPAVWEHSIRVAGMMVLIADHMAPEATAGADRGVLLMAGMLHDIGKIRLPAALLGKGMRLTVADRAALEQHPTVGAAMLQGLDDVPAPVIEAALGHHERWNATGYPMGTCRGGIPPIARLCAVADVLDAITAQDRPYRLPQLLCDAIHEVVRAGGDLFDPTMTSALARVPLDALDDMRRIEFARAQSADMLDDLEAAEPGPG